MTSCLAATLVSHQYALFYSRAVSSPVQDYVGGILARIDASLQRLKVSGDQPRDGLQPAPNHTQKLLTEVTLPAVGGR